MFRNDELVEEIKTLKVTQILLIKAYPKELIKTHIDRLDRLKIKLEKLHASMTSDNSI